MSGSASYAFCAKYALRYLCAKDIVNIRVCVFWIRLKHRMIGKHCRVPRSFYRLTKNKVQPKSSSHNTFNKEIGFSWKIRREWPERPLPSCQVCRLTASLFKGFVVSKASRNSLKVTDLLLFCLRVLSWDKLKELLSFRLGSLLTRINFR